MRAFWTAARIEWLRDRAEGVANAINAIDLTTRTMVELSHPVLAEMVGHQFALSDGTSGQLTANGVLLNGNFDAVDRFAGQTGGLATIFAKQGDQFMRIATSLKKENDARCGNGGRAQPAFRDRRHFRHRPAPIASRCRFHGAPQRQRPTGARAVC